MCCDLCNLLGCESIGGITFPDFITDSCSHHCGCSGCSGCVGGTSTGCGCKCGCSCGCGCGCGCSGTVAGTTCGRGSNCC